MEKFLRSFVFSLLIILLSQGITAQTGTAPSGSGTSGDPYLISSLANLYWISQNPAHWDKNYIQTADIDASATAQWNGGEGWEPIGTEAYPFNGVYDGAGFTISGLFIDRIANNEQGLFGKVTEGHIKNTRLTGIKITGQERIGGLAGNVDENSVIENCHIAGEVSGYIYVGGLAGINDLSVIKECSSSTIVSAGHQFSGGLVGRNWSDGVISESFSTGSVSGNGQVGGLVGLCFGVINNCYSTANVFSVNDAGGLVGDKYGEITNSYSTGSSYSDTWVPITPPGAQAKANQLGVKGYAKNKSDDSVQIEAEAEEKALNDFVAWCRKGPDHAVVQDIETEVIPVINDSVFNIRY